jgi:Rad3-related DNA helicase
LKELNPSIVDKSKLEAELLLIELKQMQKSLNDYANRGESDPQTVVVRACKEKLTGIMRSIRGVYGEDIDPAYADNWLVFLETAYTTKRQPYGVLNLKPIDVAPLMRMNILDVIETSVFLSATMRTGPNFSFMRRELGIGDDCLEFVGESPFDFEKNVMGYFPTHLPDAKDPRYLDELALEILAVLRHSKGRGLILFTNNSHMRYCYEACSARLPYNCYMQGQASKPVLIDMFKSDVQSCLFATRTFFTGIDIPGEALSCLILTKAPFQVPTDPMFKAKSEKIEDDGGNSFSMLALPLMLFDVRQGFGRLVRTTSDKGIFAFLDSRALSKSYGNRIISSLPRIPIIESLDGKPRIKKVSKSSSRTPVKAKKSALSFASLEADDD